ncbi:MAG: 23S rRNA (uracil(1939)-C(5))-methyltransferase RlmD [Chloroflexi bacterium]|nr:23S rRNA (uracil(1939)-C(5))-methyltransferase RlmD [Chloroflexota bacterium]
MPALHPVLGKQMGKQIVVQLTDMAHGGESVGRYEGKAIFVPYGIPGESVRVEIVRDRGRFAQARMLEVLSASPHRVQPPCPHFGTCGGCHWQHLHYRAQLEHKQAIVRAQLQRIAGLAEAAVRPTLGAAYPWQYRNHVQFSVGRSGELGFMAAASHRVVAIERCLLMHPLLEEIFDSLDVELPGLQGLHLRAGIQTGEQMIIFEMADDEPPELYVDWPVSCVLLLSDGTPMTLVGSSYIHESMAGRMYRLSAPSFFQVNTQQAERLVHVVSDYLLVQPDSVVIDAYCGVGTFALALAAKAKQVIGIEANPFAIADAEANAFGLDNVTFFAGNVGEVMPTLDASDVLVVLDPPREGIDRAALEALLTLSPQRIVYVSCDPATLARDVKDMVTAGYHLGEVQTIDMFPQTFHIESVAVLFR